MRQTKYISSAANALREEELEQNSAADLQDAVAEGADEGGRDLSEGGRVQRSVRRRQIGEIENVGRLTAKLEGYALPDREVAEDGCVDVAPPRSIERILTDSSIGACRTRALLWASSNTVQRSVGHAELRVADPILDHRNA